MLKTKNLNGLVTIWPYFLVILLHPRLIQDTEGVVSRPNIVLLLADDLGIGDLGCYGNTTIRTPNIDKLSIEGVTLGHHLSVAGLCTPSRAALLTGRYPARYGLVGDVGSPPVIVHVASKVGLPESETTLAEVLSGSGYVTSIVGKWHLGSGCGWFGTRCLGPLSHGFDSFYGLLFTLTSVMEGVHPFWIWDMADPFYQGLLVSLVVGVVSMFCLWRRKVFVGIAALFLLMLTLLPIAWLLYTHFGFHTDSWWQVSPWMDQNLNGVISRNGTLVRQTIPFDSLFQDLAAESVSFIHASAGREEPFFLFHSFAHVHTPLFASEGQAGKSAHGRYGDNVEEMDSGVGLILAALWEENLEENTIVYFASDHGGHLEAVDPRDGQRVGGHNKMFKAACLYSTVFLMMSWRLLVCLLLSLDCMLLWLICCLVTSINLCGGKGMGAPEGAIRVPGIFRWPGVLPTGSEVDAPTSLLDILPTFIELAGLPPLQTLVPEAKELDGRSFASLLKEPTTPQGPPGRKRVLLHHCGRDIHGLRLVTDTKVYKMYLYLHRWHPNSTQCGWGIETLCCCFGDHVIDVTESPVLYELNSDPYENQHIDPTTPEYENVVAELKCYLKDWRRNVTYPPSQFNSKLNTILSPWLQPLKILT